MLRPAFMAACGPIEDDGQFLRASEAFLADPRYQQLALEVASQGRPSGQLTETYRTWLTEEGFCGNNYTNEVRLTATQVISGSTPEDRYESWSPFFSQYNELMSLLLSAVQETDEISPELQSVILLAANRLQIFATESDIVKRIFNGRSFGTDAIIAAQNAAIQDMRRAISETINIMSAGVLEGFELDKAIMDVSKTLNDAWAIFNDPFYYIFLLGEELAAKPANIRFTVGVFDLSHGVFDNVPILKPENPGKLREIIGDVLAALSEYGTEIDPVEVEFSWDQPAGALLINVISNNSSLIFDPPWNRLKEKLGQFPLSYQQTSMFGHTVTIPVPLSGAPVSSASGGGSSGSSPPVSGGGFVDIGSSGEPMAASADPVPRWSTVFSSDVPSIEIYYAGEPDEITAADSYEDYEEIESVDEEYDLTSELTDYDEAELFFATAPVETGAAVFAEFLP